MQGIMVAQSPIDSAKLDAVDRAILACLGAKMPRTEIAEALKIDRVTIHRRLKAIRDRVESARSPQSTAS